MSFRHPLSTLALGLAATFGTTGCEKVLGVDYGSAQLEPPFGAGGAGSLCDPLVPPVRPPDLAPATAAIEFTVVLKDLDFGDSEPDAGPGSYLDVGFDLDGVCTGAAGSGPVGCTPLPWLGEVRPDGPRGQDNSIGLLTLDQPKVFGISGVSSDVVNASVAQGVESPAGVLRVRGYSGLGNDDHVEVDWFAVEPFAAGADAGRLPAFDESDSWPLRQDDLADPAAATSAVATSKYRDPDAFVLRGILVVHFPVLGMLMRNVLFEFTDATLTADVGRLAATNQWVLSNGVVGARTKPNSLVYAIPRLAYEVFGVSLCTDDQANYPGVKKYVCSSADLPASGPANAAAPCVSSSFGMSFATAPASLGTIAKTAPPPDFCPPATSPLNDTCDAP